MSPAKAQQIIAAILFLTVFDALYSDYLAVTFEYVYFYKIDRGLSFKIIVYILSILPLLVAGRGKTPCTIGVNLIYTVGFLPSLLVIQYMSRKESAYVLYFLMILTVNMIILFCANRLASHPLRPLTDRPPSHAAYKTIVRILSVLGVASVSVLMFYFYDSMKLVGLQDVYRLRAAADEVQRPGVVGYATLFLTYSCIPFLVGYGLLYKQRLPVILGLFSAFVLYVTFGAKMALAMPVVIYFSYKFLLSHKNPLLLLISCLGVISLILWLADLSDTPYEILKAIFAVRAVANTGWVLEKYDEFFSVHGYSYWLHIGVLGSLVDGEVTDKLQLGQLIGEHYFGDPRANYSAGFWASDGIASAGVLGLFVPTIVLSFFIVSVNRAARNIDYKLVSLWFVGVWLTIMNAPVTVAFIGAGGVLNLLSLYFLTPREGRCRVM